MAIINGTAANDVINGTTVADVIDGGAGNDRINSGAGDDIIYGGLGNDTLTGDAGNDTLYGGEGNDGFFGGGGNDTIYGENGDDNMFGDGGNDFIYGGAGNDQLTGSTGDDTLFGGAGINILNGGAGNDTFVLELTSAGITADIRADLVTLKNFMDSQLAAAGSLAALAAQTTSTSLTLSALGVTINGLEQVNILVDGVSKPLTSLINQAPVADATASLLTAEDTAISGQVIASDVDGDTLSFATAQGPANGTLTLNASTGAYTYTPGANFNGSDSFTVVVADPSGLTATQTVNVGIAAVNDGPVAAASASLSTQEDTPVSGQVVASDVDGDTLSFATAQGPANGTLTLNAATGAYSYAANANYNGADSFQVTVADGQGGTATQTVNVGIAAVNDGPVAIASASLSTQEDTVFPARWSPQMLTATRFPSQRLKAQPTAR